MELKFSGRFIGNLQLTNSNLKLSHCYGIFLTSLNLIRTKPRNPTQPCDDLAHPRTLQETLHTPSERWDRDPGITSCYAKSQVCSIFSAPRQIKYHSLFGITFQQKSRWYQSIDLFHKSVYWVLYDTSPHRKPFENIL